MGHKHLTAAILKLVTYHMQSRLNTGCPGREGCLEREKRRRRGYQQRANRKRKVSQAFFTLHGSSLVKHSALLFIIIDRLTIQLCECSSSAPCTRCEPARDIGLVPGQQSGLFVKQGDKTENNACRAGLFPQYSQISVHIQRHLLDIR
jgi:hypothetical protein